MHRGLPTSSFPLCAAFVLLLLGPSSAAAGRDDDVRTIGLSGIPEFGVDQVVSVPGSATQIYVYLRNPGEEIQSLDFGLDFDFLGSASLPSFFLGGYNFLTGESLTRQGAGGWDFSLRWSPCLPNQPHITVARFDMLYLSGTEHGVVCLGPTTQAMATAPTYVSCDGLTTDCLGPADSYDNQLVPSGQEQGAPPCCILVSGYGEFDFDNEMPWECENSITVVPTEEGTWSALKAGWQR